MPRTSSHDPDLAQLIAEASDTWAPSQAELAAEIGVQPLALTTWRTGRSRPTREHLEGMAQALERRGEQLRNLAARLEARAAAQGPLTRRPRRAPADRHTAEEMAERMAAAGQGRVLRIVFYGSRARGAPRSPTSDFDFIVVLHDFGPDAEAEEVWLRRAAGGGVHSVALDIWPMDQETWDTGRRLHGHPVRSADQEGIVLHESG